MELTTFSGVAMLHISYYCFVVAMSEAIEEDAA